jgi:hypothetical protein
MHRQGSISLLQGIRQIEGQSRSHAVSKEGIWQIQVRGEHGQQHIQ